MLLTTRAYQLASVPDKNSDRLASPYIRWSPSWKDQLAAQKYAWKMLLVHQTGSVKVGEVVRYTVTYEPTADRILPSPTHLHVKIKNSSAIPLRAAYLHGPYTLHVAVYPSDFNPNHKIETPRKDGVPQFEPNLKAGGSFTAKIPVPDDIRVTEHSITADEGQKHKSLTWIIEITSQIIFSSSASVNYELLVSRDERSLDYSFAAIPGQGEGHGEPGRVHDHQQSTRRHRGRAPAQQKGVYSRAVKLVVDDTESLWNTPALPETEDSHKKIRTSIDIQRRKSSDKGKSSGRKKKKIHLVVLTHGLHSNLSADMLYLKESIDATAKQARENRRNRRGTSSKTNATHKDGGNPSKGNVEDPSIAPLSGGQENLHDDDYDSTSDDDDEEVIVRGFSGNAVRTENGIQYLGKRLAKHVLDLTYPDQPYKPIRKSMSKKLSEALSTRSSQDSERDKGKAAHEGSTIRLESAKTSDLAYTFSSISFVGHSLGGLIQLYAIGYIQKHAPNFFDQIKPVNFICMASPLLGLSNENPMYVKFALDFGLVGRTGQDLGLTWRPPTLAKSGWSAMMGGLGAGQKDQQQDDPGAKPLLRILPTGPAHRVLRMFRNRTVYSNVVNDGIVPLRTSCLLFLDWRGLGRVEKARRENGIIGTMAGWGWAEIMGQSSSPTPSRVAVTSDNDSQNDSDAPEPSGDGFETSVPQPPADATNQDDEVQAPGPSEHQFSDHSKQPAPGGERSVSGGSSALDGLRNFLGLTAKTTKKDLKMYKRSQTVKVDGESVTSASTPRTESNPDSSTNNKSKRPLATRGDSILEDPSNSNAPPKTTIFESAGDILNPPIPPTSWITDPSSRSRTIFHDRVYHPEDIPPPPTKRPKTSRSTSSSNEAAGASISFGAVEQSTQDSNGMRVEEKIARAYHKDLSWRKVLVRLEPDAHNNMIVRRMFANAYGWPVIKHLCDTHFGDTYTATTRDENEPATDRAKGIEKPVGKDGEHVKGQADVEPPPRPPSEMREEADELKPLRTPKSEDSPRPTTSATTALGSSYDSWDEVYFQDTTDDEDNKGLVQRLWSPPPIFGGGGKSESSQAGSKRASAVSNKEDAPSGTTQAEIADFLTATPPPLEGHRGLEPVPMAPGRASTSEVGLRKSVEEMVGRPKSGSEGEVHNGVSEQVARSLGSPTQE